MNSISKTSPDILKERLNQLKKLFPDLFTNENQLNEEELRNLLSQFTTPQTERYEFRWAGKTHSKKLAFTPSKATLVPDEKRSVDFDKTENIIIEGDNLEILKLLQKSYFDKIKCIYIDPPYNIGTDVIYNDDYSESKKAYWEKGSVTKDGVKLDTNSEAEGRYHSNWLGMMQSRLLLARNLLSDDGVIFVSIDDDEVTNLKKLMDEIFGQENFISQNVRVSNSAKNTTNFASVTHDYILIYVKDKAYLKEIKTDWKVKKNNLKDYLSRINRLIKLKLSNEEISEELRILTKYPKFYEFDHYYYVDDKFPKLGPYASDKPGPSSGGKGYTDFSLPHPVTKKLCKIPSTGWAMDKKKAYKMLDEDRWHFGEDENTIPRPKAYLNEHLTSKFGGIQFFDSQVDAKFLESIKIPFDFPKPVEMLKQLISLTGEDSIILDFFAGSGSTAHAVMDLNKEDGGKRKFLLVQLPELTDKNSDAYKSGFKTISDICIKRVKLTGEIIKKEDKTVDTGFKVFKLTYSHFPENLFSPDPNKSEEENIQAFNKYLEKLNQQVLFNFDFDKLLYEIALKDGFNLNFKTEHLGEFKDNKIVKIKDDTKEALVCLDQSISDKTVELLKEYKDQRFICLKRAIDTTKKWNLQQLFDKNLWVA